MASIATPPSHPRRWYLFQTLCLRSSHSKLSAEQVSALFPAAIQLNQGTHPFSPFLSFSLTRILNLDQSMLFFN